ncbi:hypothetical protein BGX33_011785, partial [Mortierella sp. NVP41]
MESAQAVRPVSKSILDSHYGSTPPPGGPVVYVDINTDPETLKRIVLWDDIKLAFDDALHIRHQAKVVPFLKGKDFNIIKPFRIVAHPDVVLDVVVSGPLAQHGATSLQSSVLHQIEQQAARLPRHNPFKTLRVPYSTPAPTNNFDRAVNNHPSVSSVSKTPSHDATTQLRNKELTLNRVKEIMVAIAARVDLEALHAKGDGPPEDFTKAMENYLKTVHKGHTHAQISVGDLFLAGQGVQKSSSVAMGWYLKAAYYGDTNAQRKIEALRLADFPRFAVETRASANGGHDSPLASKGIPMSTDKVQNVGEAVVVNNPQSDTPATATSSA